MSQFHLVITLVGLLVLVIGIVSRFTRERLFITEPMLALLAGILLGPEVLGILDPRRWGPALTIFEETTRLTLAIGLMGVALRLPPTWLSRSWRPVALILAVMMPLMWAASGLLVWLLAGTSFWGAFLVGAVITPTDPVVASTIVTGDLAVARVPERLRHLLSAESGFNDGLAYPLVMLAILFVGGGPGAGVGSWVLRDVLWRTVGAGLFGALLGLAAGKVLLWAERTDTIEFKSFLAFSLALALTSLGGAKLMRTDGVLAVFVTGVVFSRLVQSEEIRREHLEESINVFFLLPSFVLLGTIIPWAAWRQLGAAGPLVAVAVLVLRRLPAMLLAAPLLGPAASRRDALYLGWFGPLGISALFYATLAHGRLEGLADGQRVWALATLVSCASILAHGVTAIPFTRALYRHELSRRKPR